MAVTVSDVTDRFPEFAGTVTEFPAMVAACLAEAELAVSDDLGSKRDQMVLLETAHRLAITPFGRNAKLSSADGKSTYGQQLMSMRLGAACAKGRQG